MQNNNDLAGGDLLTLRADPSSDARQRDFITRGVVVRAATVDIENRSVEVTLTSDAMVTVYDPQSGRVIDEVLLAEGGSFADQIPLLANHDRWSLDGTIGSIREIRRDGANWIGRAYFVKNDEQADKAWNKVSQGHLRDISAGYRATQYIDIPAGQTGNVAGRSFTASAQRPLRISQQWQGVEGSLVPIGADRTTKVREQPASSGKENSMHKALRQYLESIGLRADASESEAQTFLKNLKGKQSERAAALGLATPTVTLEETLRAELADALSTRGSVVEQPVVTPAAAGTTTTTVVTPSQRSVEQVATDAIRAERERMTQIRTLAGDDRDGIPGEMITRAESEGWTIERASREFLTHLRGSRTPPLGNEAPGGIVRNRERDATRSSIGLALAMRSGVNVEQWGKRHAVKIDNLAQQAQRYSDMSLLDVCREALRLDGKEIPVSRDETIRAAVSGASLTQIFTTSVNAVLLQAYEEEPDTTIWVEEGEVADFKTNTAIRYAGNAALKKLGRGNTAEHANAEDSAETYKVARYAKQFVADEQDIIDDSMNALSDMPREFGQAARRLRPDLVYAMVLNGETATMADTGAVFNSTALTTAGGHANYAAAGTDILGGALSAASLQAAIVAMRKQYRGTGRNKVQLNIVPEVLLVPPDLQFTAEILLTSAERFKDSSDGSYNPLRGKLKPVVEARLGTIGVTDPDSGTAYTGTAVNYFLASRPGLHAKVAYRRGTGRAPVIRSFVLDKGQWGIGWDVNLDIGVKFIDFRGIFKAKGAA